MMNLLVNGEAVQLPASTGTVAELLAHFGLMEKVVIVEHNQVILEKANHQETRLADGDRIEIVHFVGGG